MPSCSQKNYVNLANIPAATRDDFEDNQPLMVSGYGQGKTALYNYM